MAKYPTTQEILALNPDIDAEKLEKAREALRKLRDNRTRRTGYGLASPLGHHRILVGEDDTPDPRTVRLGRLRP